MTYWIARSSRTHLDKKPFYFFKTDGDNRASRGQEQYIHVNENEFRPLGAPEVRRFKTRREAIQFLKRKEGKDISIKDF